MKFNCAGALSVELKTPLMNEGTLFLAGMVLVRSESGQLLMFHQQTLAQMKAQSQSQSAVTPRLSAPASTPPVQVTSLQVPAIVNWCS